MGQENVQISFFQHIKALLPPHLSPVDEIAELLNISNDSAYRRIRGEKPISFDELQKLCGHFKISLDQFLHLQSDSLVFTGRSVGQGAFDYEQYLTDVLRNVQLMNSFPSRELYYLNKDIPVFHYFLFPEMVAFKSFFWVKTILHYPQYANQTFRLDDFKAAHSSSPCPAAA
ncbi:MAG TPA: helix-turn-helix transcriptional regulator [Puia sp.]